MKSYMEQVAEAIETTSAAVKRDVEAGMDLTDAINRNAHTAETYAAMLKNYNLKPVIPD